MHKLKISAIETESKCQEKYDLRAPMPVQTMEILMEMQKQKQKEKEEKEKKQLE